MELSNALKQVFTILQKHIDVTPKRSIQRCFCVKISVEWLYILTAITEIESVTWKSPPPLHSISLLYKGMQAGRISATVTRRNSQVGSLDSG